MKVELEDADWVRLIDGCRDDSALPTCCANISELRDTIIYILRNGCYVPEFIKREFLAQYDAVMSGHEFLAGNPLDELAKQMRGPNVHHS